jgi:hypothetical protein
VTDKICFPCVTARLTANGYSPDEAAEIVRFARTNASPGPWIKVFAGAGAERARHQQALELAFPRASPESAEHV